MSDCIDKIIAIRDQLNADDQKQFSDSQFAYIYYKADRYLKVGAKEYRKKDMCSMPDPDWDQKGLGLVSKGCTQIIEGNGFIQSKPFKDIGVIGINLLFSLFHFEITEVKTINIDNNKVLDKIKLRHLQNEFENDVIYYNLLNKDQEKSNTLN